MRVRSILWILLVSKNHPIKEGRFRQNNRGMRNVWDNEGEAPYKFEHENPIASEEDPAGKSPLLLTVIASGTSTTE
ncbi:hypothetical protein U1Q18_048571 [Sarracenia purpurea var. burkii]